MIIPATKLSPEHDLARYEYGNYMEIPTTAAPARARTAMIIIEVAAVAASPTSKKNTVQILSLIITRSA